MNIQILELIFNLLFSIGLIIIVGIIFLYIMFKDIIEHNKTICPICGKGTKGQHPCYFMRNRKLYHVHQGDCTEIFLFGERKYGVRFLSVLDKLIKDRFQRKFSYRDFRKLKRSEN